jgi:putative nucleotidyltransferase with HDIG domain
MSRLDEIIARVGDIQPLPGTVVRLISVVNDPQSTVNDIVETIRYDQALTARMLRLCNSAYFGLTREVESLEDAMKILGTLKLLQLVMAVHTSALLGRRQEGYGLEPGILWKQSVAVALASTLFAERTRPENLGLTFTAGLLHDIGKVLLNDYVVEEFTQIYELVSQKQMSFDQAEREVLGCSSTEIGARMGEQWKLPESIIRCIRYHRTPGELNPPDVLVDTVYLANNVVMLCGIGLGTDGLCYRADPAIMERYRIKEGDLELIGAQMLMDFKRVEAVFADRANAEAVPQARERVHV